MRESPNPLFPLSTRMFCCLILSFVFTFGFVHTNFSGTLVALFGFSEFHNLRTDYLCQAVKLLSFFGDYYDPLQFQHSITLLKSYLGQGCCSCCSYLALIVVDLVTLTARPSLQSQNLSLSSPYLDGANWRQVFTFWSRTQLSTSRLALRDASKSPNLWPDPFIFIPLPMPQSLSQALTPSLRSARLLNLTPKTLFTSLCLFLSEILNYHFTEFVLSLRVPTSMLLFFGFLGFVSSTALWLLGRTHNALVSLS